MARSVGLLSVTPEYDTFKYIKMEEFKTLKVKNGFTISGENPDKYEHILLSFKSVDRVTKSELRDGLYIVRLKDKEVLHIKNGVHRLRQLTGDNTLQVGLKYTHNLPRLGSLLQDDGCEDYGEKWNESLPIDMQNINKIVKEKALLSDKNFKFSPLYRLLHERLSNAAVKKCDYMIITTDFLVGCGYTPSHCPRTLRNMEQLLVEQCGFSSRISVYDICDRLTYKGAYIANPITGSYSNMCLIVPMDKLGLIFYNSTHPSAKSIGNYMSSLFNATVIYANERDNLQMDNFRREIKFAENEVNMKEEELKELRKRCAVSEEQRISLRDVHKKSSIATSRYDGGACLVFAFSDRDFSLLCRTNGNGSFYSATEEGIRYVSSPEYKKRDVGERRPRLIMSITGSDAPICIRDSVRNHFKTRLFSRTSGNSITFAVPPGERELMEMVREVTGTDIKIFMDNGKVYQNGAEINVIDPTSKEYKELLKREENLPEDERKRLRRERRMIFNTSRAISMYNEERGDGGSGGETSEDGDGNGSTSSKGEKRKREENEGNEYVVLLNKACKDIKVC
ncbi:hypothetical protein SWSSV_gp171 [White spot syndrome virus]|uniref:Wsv497 n=4 Tax=White spot syndrome virus TaxID=342409 RepID=Q8VAC8_WSSVS|nr:wsv497 [Shrimp white spot syndrome virus]YP_009220645.1 hypothetical protein SWSSV_gp171 [White spot syndrome virus]AAL33498.1 wsv497 [Shrimp white spot syndrome virus]ALN66614.1 hypothetical protein [White spot syndrome virus]QHB92447.1 hypothetical protein [White spot syndrome virus]WUY11340.1 hypothetical protein [White spot syndrome virus]WUY11512.1 hypothetical protein [White spot syndrome virus]